MLSKTNNAAAIYHRIAQAGNDEQANKILDLIEKVDRQEINICFAGHFSAGKSSMINFLIGEEILPQSPIPTSANVVSITSGDGSALIYFYNQQPMKLLEPYDLEQLQKYCTDGDAIARVDIHKRTDAIPENVAILDTPGIDSSNDADRVITESSLHTVDVLFYVMDYNHVQSEVNLHFLKEMQDKGKPLYIIVNQIDKHKSEELTWEAFQTSVEQTMNAWGIHPEAIYFTSLKNCDHKRNQLHVLQNKIHELMTETANRIEYTLEQSLTVIIDEYIDWLSETNQTEKAELVQKLEAFKKHDLSTQELERKQEKLHTLKQKPTTVENQLRHTVDDTLKNAYLMPFELRELAQAFLTSQQTKFKPGLFSSKKKIALEQQHRLDSFYDALMSSVQANIEWKLREKLLQVAKDQQIQDQSIFNAIQQLTITYPKQRLPELIKHGASMTGEYLLVYTDDLANDIKKSFKNAALDIHEKIIGAVRHHVQTEQNQLEKELQEQESYQQIVQKLKEIDTGVSEEQATILQLQQDQNVQIDLATIKDKINSRDNKCVLYEKQSNNDTSFSSSEIEEVNIKETNKQNKQISAAQALKYVTETRKKIDQMPGFKGIQDDLETKQQRLANRHYTVALFGAFSAGKSSFANALIGENILPVSPNPTTATINKISPPDSVHSDRTVNVQFKTEAAIVEEIRQMTETKNTKGVALSEWITWLEQEYIPNNNEIDVKQHTFLQALIQGYQEVKVNLGKQNTIALDQFPRFVVEESLACYVDWMELFYDCPLTRQGITLVDTPGADSINQRHTNVAFEYIKNADAILFVTYYNHAFSKADRTFLQQLGRVKDAFSLDKMFFLINAKDLAKDDQELNLVTNYVKEKLQSYGIQKPRMFPVSSHQALQAKQGTETINTSGMPVFEESFYHFMQEELLEILVQSAVHDIRRVQKQLSAYIASASRSNQEKETLLVTYKNEQKLLYDELNTFDYSNYMKEISQKIDKQVYYVGQRMTIQFSDVFKEHINPATVNGKGKEANEQLKSNIKQLINEVGFELSQELRAVSLRMEAFINKKAEEFNQQLNSLCQTVEPELDLASIDENSLKSPSFKNAFDSLELQAFASALKLFKTPKAFFEQNEKEVMKERVLEILTPHVNDYLEENQNKIITHYQKNWELIAEEVKQKASNSIEQYYLGFTHALTTEIDVEELQSKLNYFDEILQNEGIE